MNRLLTPEIIMQRAAKNKMKKVAEKERIKREKIDKMISSCEDEFIKKICELFINRWDCYAIQDNTNPLLFPTVYQELTIDIIKESLSPDSNITIGIHQIDNNKVKWLCYDIDKKHTPDPKSLSDQIVKYLKEWYNLHGYLEPSGSPDSYHVWVFTELTDVDIAINFHKTFKNGLKSVGVDVGAIEKGVSKGEKGLGCMIKLPFNIQRKTNKRSKLLADISNIIPERIPIVSVDKMQIQNTQKISQIITSNPKSDVFVSVCILASKDVCGDIFESNDMCWNIISKMPKIMHWMCEEQGRDRSILDYWIISALVDVGISKKTISKFLYALPDTITKIHDRGDSYFDLSYSKVISSRPKVENRWHTAWKNVALKSGMETEVRFTHNGCVADIYDPKRRVVTEIQHGSINPEVLANRCSFYESLGIKIRWLFDYREKYDTGNLALHIDEDHEENVFICQTCPRNIGYLFDDVGIPKYDIYFNIEYDFSNDTHTTLKIGKMFGDGSGYGRLYSSIHNREMMWHNIKQVPFNTHKWDDTSILKAIASEKMKNCDILMM